jgi:leucyl-tRNA synthetase
MDAHNTDGPFSREKADYWLPVDLYVGGAEHAVLHLLYARFWHKVMYDLGLVSCVEPFQKLVNQGMILGADNQKMSKSRGNVVNPDDIVAEFGADALRLYEMFMGPLEAVKPWKTSDIIGIVRFLDKVWKIGLRPQVPGWGGDEVERATHRTIRKVTGDIEGLRFNTAISALMVLSTELLAQKETPRDAWMAFLKLLGPFAPHIAEELRARAGGEGSIAHETWPTWDEALCVENTVEIVVQVNGKVRARFDAARGLPREALEATALKVERVAELLAGLTVRKVISVPDKLVNIVAG